MNSEVELTRNGVVKVSLYLQPSEARRLARIVRVAIAHGALSDPTEKRSWGQVVRRITKLVKEPSLLYRKDVERPSGEYGPNEMDMDHVVNGNPPWPVLSLPDVERVWPRLEARRLTGAEVARRLHLSERTVWRRRRRDAEKEKEKGNGRETSGQC